MSAWVTPAGRGWQQVPSAGPAAAARPDVKCLNLMVLVSHELLCPYSALAETRIFHKPFQRLYTCIHLISFFVGWNLLMKILGYPFCFIFYVIDPCLACIHLLWFLLFILVPSLSVLIDDNKKKRMFAEMFERFQNACTYCFEIHTDFMCVLKI